MAENATKFKLASSSPIFDRNIINQIGHFSESAKVQELIHYRTPIETDNLALISFFQLFHNPNYSPISCEISTDHWI